MWWRLHMTAIIQPHKASKCFTRAHWQNIMALYGMYWYRKAAPVVTSNVCHTARAYLVVRLEHKHRNSHAKACEVLDQLHVEGVYVLIAEIVVEVAP
jgi:hypothetical protein